jgi:hypothetical protein
MNKLFTTVFLCIIASVVQAQQEMLELARADIRSGRMGMIASSLELSAAQQEIFWPLYRKYADEQDALLDRRIDMLKNFARSYSQIDAQQAREIAEQSFAIQRERTARREKYFEEIAQALDPVIAARFIQIDSQISTLLDFELMRNTPLIAAPQRGDTVRSTVPVDD